MSLGYRIGQDCGRYQREQNGSGGRGICGIGEPHSRTSIYMGKIGESCTSFRINLSPMEATPIVIDETCLLKMRPFCTFAEPTTKMEKYRRGHQQTTARVLFIYGEGTGRSVSGCFEGGVTVGIVIALESIQMGRSERVTICGAIGKLPELEDA